MKFVWQIQLDKTAQNIHDQDKGYFGIFTYFVQMAGTMKIQIGFSEINKSQSFWDSVVHCITASLNIELAQLSFNVCPIIGLTTVGKHLYKVIFLSGIYVAWVGMGMVTLILMHIFKICKQENLVRKIHIFKIKLIKGITEIFKYTYSGFCGVVFTSPICTQILEQSWSGIMTEQISA